MGVTGDNLAGLLLDGAIERGLGERTAIFEGERQVSYSELADTARRLATVLRGLGVNRGDRVAVYMRDSIEASASILGCLHAGTIAVPISELATASDVRDILNDSGAICALVSGALEPTLEEIRGEAPKLKQVLVATPGGGDDERDWNAAVSTATPAVRAAQVAPDEPAFVLYSAGARATDGAVRGVVHTHRTPLLAFESIRDSIAPMSEGDRVFSIVRLSTAYGLGFGLLYPLAAGAEAILLSKQPRTDVVVAALDRHQPTVFAATPSVYRQLARDVAGTLAPPLSNTRACLAGAEDMPANVIAAVETSLGAKVTVGYGLTEAFQFVVAASMKDGRAGACGRPLPGFELRIVDDEGNEVGDDEIGTLEIRGSAVSTRYWGTTRAIRDEAGWFTTRDRFMRDGDGFFYHCGRVDHLFKVSGKWVAPDEVERALLSHEAVWECAVIGADDEDGLIKPLAFVVPNIGHDPDADLEATLREFVKSEIAPYKYPRWIEFVEELPKGPSGKLLRYKLHDRIRGTRSRRRAETASG